MLLFFRAGEIFARIRTIGNHAISQYSWFGSQHPNLTGFIDLAGELNLFEFNSAANIIFSYRVTCRMPRSIWKRLVAKLSRYPVLTFTAPNVRPSYQHFATVLLRLSKAHQGYWHVYMCLSVSYGSYNNHTNMICSAIKDILGNLIF
jgi:hypothetical protein